jgi:hypothetical protein
MRFASPFDMDMAAFREELEMNEINGIVISEKDE